jgi:hypothetical protein
VPATSPCSNCATNRSLRHVDRPYVGGDPLCLTYLRLPELNVAECCVLSPGHESTASSRPIGSVGVHNLDTRVRLAREDGRSGLVSTITAPAHQGSRSGPSAASDLAARRHQERLPPTCTTPPTSILPKSARPALQTPADNRKPRMSSSDRAARIDGSPRLCWNDMP